MGSMDLALEPWIWHGRHWGWGHAPGTGDFAWKALKNCALKVCSGVGRAPGTMDFAWTALKKLCSEGLFLSGPCLWKHGFCMEGSVKAVFGRSVRGWAAPMQTWILFGRHWHIELKKCLARWSGAPGTMDFACKALKNGIGR